MDINYNTQEISVKIVFYGPGLSGKTTNLEIIHAKTPENNRGNLTAISTDQDRTLFFDYMPLEVGKIGAFKVRLRLFTVPGQVYYNTTRKLVLRGVDGVVFVADSQASKMPENVESLENLRVNLAEQGENLDELPVLLQYNKRDLPNICTMEEIDAILNQDLKAPSFPAVAVKGEGVFQSLKKIANMTMTRVENMMKKPRRKKIKKIDSKPRATESGKPKIQLGKRPFNQPIHTPPRGLPSIGNMEKGKAPTVNIRKPITRTMQLSEIPKKPTTRTMQIQPGQLKKPGISKDSLFQGRLSKSKPLSGGNTPPSSMTPISNRSLQEKKEHQPKQIKKITIKKPNT